MRSFKEIRNILGELPEIKKFYLLGATGSGKTSLIQQIIGTTKLSFPATSHRRTTASPTEYVINKDLPFKTTILFKKKEEIISSIEELVQEAIQKALEANAKREDIVFELEQTSDERFKLKHIIPQEMFLEKATSILQEIVPLIKELDVTDETLFSPPEVSSRIQRIINDFLMEMERLFQAVGKSDYQLFSDAPFYIEEIHDKEDFIKRNRALLNNEFGSIAALVEYVRIEGDLLADWFDERSEFVVIDDAGIGHTLRKKQDPLSIRHYEFFNFCDHIILMENADNPFAANAQDVVEGLFLNGYKNKFKLAFSKVDKVDVGDLKAYFRRNLKNLSNGLKKERITFELKYKDTFKLENLNSAELKEFEKKEIQKLFTPSETLKESQPISLEYDYGNFFSGPDRNKLIEEFHRSMESESWTVIKALSKRMLNRETEYRHLKPLVRILTFIMREVHLFLQREDQLQPEISYAQNIIKQKFSKKIIHFIWNALVFEKDHLWKQAYEKSGYGSHKKRLDFIFEQILKPFLPEKKDPEAFEVFKNKIKGLLLESGAEEIKPASKIKIEEIKISKIYQENGSNFRWLLGNAVHILIGKNGSGKSTILKLIDACINKNQEILEHYGYPYVELTISKEYEGGVKKEFIVNNSQSLTDLKSIMISTFDAKSSGQVEDGSDLDFKLQSLVSQFGQYQRSLAQTITKKTKSEKARLNEIRENIETAEIEDLVELKNLSISIDKISGAIHAPITKFKQILDLYFKDTNKEIIVDDAREPLLVTLNKDKTQQEISIKKISSGEKQLLIIFLTVLLQENRPVILLMDEPETSMHVEWQSSFIDRLREINPNIQIIIATHNPLIALNRNRNEIGVIQLDNEEVQTKSVGTKYLDVSSVLLEYFELSSLVGSDMQQAIRDFTALKLRENDLTPTEESEKDRLGTLLENSFVGDIIYNEKYFIFLKYLRDHKDIDFEKYEQVDEEEMNAFLDDFGGFFHD